MKRIAVATALLMGLALPAAATTIGIDHEGGQPYITSHEGGTDLVYADVVGHYLVVSFDGSEYSPDAHGGTGNLVSFDISDPAINGATVSDWTVVFSYDTPVDVVEETVVFAEVDVEVRVVTRPVCDVFVDTLEYVCSLPNLTLRIS